MIPTLAFLIGLGLGGGIVWLYLTCDVLVKIEDFQQEAGE